MTAITADAWTADWLVGWLAAIGVTYRCRNAALSWSDESSPRALIHGVTIETLRAAFPTREEICSISVSDALSDGSELPRNPSHAQYAHRAQLARENQDLFLGVISSDIGSSGAEVKHHSPFNVPDGSGRTFGSRVRKTYEDAIKVDLESSLNGFGRVGKSQGLGFDLRRIQPKPVPTKAFTDPCAEIFALYGILAFSQVGNSTRGWLRPQSHLGAFKWATWDPPLRWHGIDALLSEFHSNSHAAAATVRRQFQSLAYQAQGAENTRGYDGVAVND